MIASNVMTSDMMGLSMVQRDCLGEISDFTLSHIHCCPARRSIFCLPRALPFVQDADSQPVSEGRCAAVKAGAPTTLCHEPCSVSIASWDNEQFDVQSRSGDLDVSADSIRQISGDLGLAAKSFEEEMRRSSANNPSKTPPSKDSAAPAHRSPSLPPTDKPSMPSASPPPPPPPKLDTAPNSMIATMQALGKGVMQSVGKRNWDADDDDEEDEEANDAIGTMAAKERSSNKTLGDSGNLEDSIVSEIASAVSSEFDYGFDSFASDGPEI
ncbi:hypothetical protein CYMTET_22777 [Cymbomonas tetramitiformis]|uniref:Uncharacterized protein n=1 Tax=Cymbomonas tetramitiformis TaxID=36881 RepID=A0AAE0FZ75_9CHLO|nr:hypothetical protein CYMTET_22777 [Cymbomonas tetramitiformis]